MPSPRAVIEGIVFENQTHFGFGPFNGGKTTFAMLLVCSVVTALPAFGHFKVHLPGDAVYCCHEAPNDFCRVRLPAWCAEYEIDPFSNPWTNNVVEPENPISDPPPGRLFVVTRCPSLRGDEAQVSKDVKNLATRLEKLRAKPRLIVIDTLAAAMVGMNQDSASDFTYVTQAVAYLRRKFDCAVWFVHHPKKANPDDMRGSSAQWTDVDVVWHSAGSFIPGAIEHTLTNMKMKTGVAGKVFCFKGKLVTVEAKDQAGLPISAPILTFDREGKYKARGGSEENAVADRKDMSFKHDVLAGLRLLDAQKKLPIGSDTLAEVIVGPQPRDPHAHSKWAAENVAMVKRLQRGIQGTKSATRKSAQAGCLAELVQLDKYGDPLKPYRVFLPEHYRIKPVTEPTYYSDPNNLGD